MDTLERGPVVGPDTGPRPSEAWTVAASRRSGAEIGTPLFVTLAEVATLRYRRGEIVVSVKDAGNGPAIDVRYWTDAREGYVPRSTRKQAVDAQPRKATREGFWMDPALAENLVDSIAQALLAVDELRGEVA